MRILMEAVFLIYIHKRHMTFRIVQSGNALPISYPVDRTAEFQPGMIAQLGMTGNNIVCGVSDGTAPFGIIDDINSRAFTAPSIDEPIISFVPPALRQNISGRYYTTYDVYSTLDNSNIVQYSFTSNPVDVALVEKNGVIIFPEGTELNFDQDGDGIPDSIRTVCSYTFQVPNIPGDDSVSASGKMTVWFNRMIYQTDQYETTQRYPVNCPLFCNENGLVTTRMYIDNLPSIGFVTGSPSAIHGTLEAMWL